jgi:hypothetical protein
MAAINPSAASDAPRLIVKEGKMGMINPNPITPKKMVTKSTTSGILDDGFKSLQIKVII